MRTELLAYFKSLKLKNFGVSEELPFTSSTVMYLKNAKRIYADLAQKTTAPLIEVMGNHGVFQDIHIVTVYFATDAKTLPSDYETVVNQLVTGRDVQTPGVNYFRREVDVTTSFEGDLMITELEFRFTKLT